MGLFDGIERLNVMRAVDFDPMVAELLLGPDDPRGRRAFRLANTGLFLVQLGMDGPASFIDNLLKDPRVQSMYHVAMDIKDRMAHEFLRRQVVHTGRMRLFWKDTPNSSGVPELWLVPMKIAFGLPGAHPWRGLMLATVGRMVDVSYVGHSGVKAWIQAGLSNETASLACARTPEFDDFVLELEVVRGHTVENFYLP